MDSLRSDFQALIRSSIETLQQSEEKNKFVGDRIRARSHTPISLEAEWWQTKNRVQRLLARVLGGAPTDYHDWEQYEHELRNSVQDKISQKEQQVAQAEASRDWRRQQGHGPTSAAFFSSDELPAVTAGADVCWPSDQFKSLIASSKQIISPRSALRQGESSPATCAVRRASPSLVRSVNLNNDSQCDHHNIWFPPSTKDQNADEFSVASWDEGLFDLSSAAGNSLSFNNSFDFASPTRAVSFDSLLPIPSETFHPPSKPVLESKATSHFNSETPRPNGPSAEENKISSTASNQLTKEFTNIRMAFAHGVPIIGLEPVAGISQCEQADSASSIEGDSPSWKDALDSNADIDSPSDQVPPAPAKVASPPSIIQKALATTSALPSLIMSDLSRGAARFREVLNPKSNTSTPQAQSQQPPRLHKSEGVSMNSSAAASPSRVPFAASSSPIRHSPNPRGFELAPKISRKVTAYNSSNRLVWAPPLPGCGNKPPSSPYHARRDAAALRAQLWADFVARQNQCRNPADTVAPSRARGRSRSVFPRLRPAPEPPSEEPSKIKEFLRNPFEAVENAFISRSKKCAHN